MTSTRNYLTSMTGFSRQAGHWRDMHWVWEAKSVNGKALDLRFRLPPGMDAVEVQCRSLAAAAMKRGNVQIGLQVQAGAESANLKPNMDLLNQLAGIAEKLRRDLDAPPIQVENLLALRGVLETADSELSSDDAASRDAALLESFEHCIAHLAEARQAEGKRLHAVLLGQLQRIAELTEAARCNPSRSPDAIRQKLATQVARLLEQSESFDPQRLHQEAILLATRADIQEEIDRLQSHIAAAHVLLASKEPVGRKFDFLAQEFNREANTLCSKANDPSLTAIGLDLKTVIDQMREQVQNIE